MVTVGAPLFVPPTPLSRENRGDDVGEYKGVHGERLIVGDMHRLHERQMDVPITIKKWGASPSCKGTMNVKLMHFLLLLLNRTDVQRMATQTHLLLWAWGV